MNNKYTVRPIPGKSWAYWLCQEVDNHPVPIAEFFNNGNQGQSKTNAQKVCDLLNETSRSQGKY